jgi:hypothetical protein
MGCDWPLEAISNALIPRITLSVLGESTSNGMDPLNITNFVSC